MTPAVDWSFCGVLNTLLDVVVESFTSPRELNRAVEVEESSQWSYPAGKTLSSPPWQASKGRQHFWCP